MSSVYGTTVQFSAQYCPTLYDPMDCSTPGFPVHHQFLELTQTHVHQVSDAWMPLSSNQPLNHVRLSASPRPTCQAPLSISNSQSLLRIMSIKSMMPSNHLILCQPLLLPSVFPSIRVFSSESVLHIKWPEDWSFSFSISPSNEYCGLISFRIDWFTVQGTLRVFSNTTVQKHQFFGAQLSL